MMKATLTRYPEGTETVVRLLSTFEMLKRSQVIRYLIQSDRTFNKERANALLDNLKRREVLFESNTHCIYMDANAEKNLATIAAFWVFLQQMDEESVCDKANYPSEIVFKGSDDAVSEIIVCDEDLLTKMDYLAKRKKRATKCKYYIMVLDDAMPELDDSLFPDVPFTFITISKGVEDTPKLRFHEVLSGENEA